MGLARKKRLLKIVLGILIGITLAQLVTMTRMLRNLCAKNEPALEPVPLRDLSATTNKSLLFVGVMTAAKYLDNRAKAVYDTWGRQVPGRIMFFSSEYSASRHVPLVPLAGVDDSYPPQKKSFHMLKYMHDHFLDQYEWFMRADDDVYVRNERLEELLRSVDSKKAWFIGQTGRGNNEEFGLLSLDSDENFCMGGPGVIMSRETLRRMAPFVDECLASLYTTHEDVELGRCVRRFAGISCTWSYEASPYCTCKMQVIFYHNNSGQAAFTGDLKQKEVHRAITLHPVKQPEYMYRLHNYVKTLKIQQLLQDSIYLHRDIGDSMRHLGYRLDRLEDVELVKDLPLFNEKRGSEHYLGNTQLLGIDASLNRFKARNLRDVLEWEFISKNIYSHRDLNPRKRISTALKEGLNDVVREIMEVVNSYSKQRGRVIDFKEILYGYWRLDPVHGVDLILDMLLVYRKYRGHKMTVQVRRHSYVQQTFTGIYIREVPYDKPPTPSAPLPVHKQLYAKITKHLEPIFHFTNQTEKTLINFVLPLSGRFEVFKRFLRLYETHCVKNDERTRLYIILYNDETSPDDLQRTRDLINRLTYDIRLIEVNESFSRGKALQYGVNAINNDNELMLFIDVDMLFDTKTLDRVRRNTRCNQTIYFPIVYSLFNPKLNNVSINDLLATINTADIVNEANGFWRQFGFGIVSLYKSDYLHLGGFDLMIHGWGNEDVTFYDNAVKSRLKIVRSVDPSLVHVYHAIKCDEHLDGDQKTMCLGTKATTLGARKRLQQLFIKYRHLFR